jgi:hypothetical protein
MIEAYPLCWPNNKPRTPKQARDRARFGKKEKTEYSWMTTKCLTVAQALSRVTRELEAFTRPGRTYRIPPDSIVISTNIKVNRHGLPYSDTKQPDDVGVAVYFQLDGRNYCLPCDKWDRVADNLAAIASHIGALRGIERWGVGETHDVFTGFRALPSTEPAKREWYVVLGINSNAGWTEAEKAYKKKVVECHPDKPGGSHEAFIELQEAWAVVEKHLKP